MRERLKRRYQILCPYGERRLQQLVYWDCVCIMACSVVVAIFLLFWNLCFLLPSVLYMAGSICLAVYILYMEITEARMRKIENVLYGELIDYLAKVKHCYASGRNAVNAVLDAAEEFGEEIRLHAATLYQILSGGNRKERVREYVTFTKYNQYLKLFLVQAYEVSEKGDILSQEGKSIFSENLEHLRLVVMEEWYHRKKKSHEYAGYTFVSLVPVFTMPILRQWGLEFAPELKAYYEGVGRCTEILALLGTYVVYCMINIAKQVYFFQIKEEYKGWKNVACFSMVKTVFERRNGKWKEHICNLLLQTGVRENYGTFMSKVLLLWCSSMTISSLVFLYVGIRHVGLILFWGGVVSVIISWVPYYKLRYRRCILYDMAEHEIRQFQSVILMERRMPDNTIPELLEDMEIFSQLFRRELRICINSYAAGPENALKRLKEEAGKIHRSFKELADGFLAIDYIGIQGAFAEIENNRDMMEKIGQLKREIQMERRKDGMELLSKLPMILTFGAYFVLPFLISSLHGVYEVFEILQELQL